MEKASAGEPFEETGIDAAGPSWVRSAGGRALSKCYMAIFACLRVRCLHVEVLADLSANAFLNALARFQPRQPGLRSLLSDNATNFSRACKDLREAAEHWPQDASAYIKWTGIVWKFAPPGVLPGEGPMNGWWAFSKTHWISQCMSSVLHSTTS